MKTRNFVIATGMTIVLVAGGSAAVAATLAASSPINSSGTIFACYNAKATRAGAYAVALQNTGTARASGSDRSHGAGRALDRRVVGSRCHLRAKRPRLGHSQRFLPGQPSLCRRRRRKRFCVSHRRRPEYGRGL